MNRNIEEQGDYRTNLQINKKTKSKTWEEELNSWMIEEFFTPYQAS